MGHKSFTPFKSKNVFILLSYLLIVKPDIEFLIEDLVEILTKYFEIIIQSDEVIILQRNLGFPLPSSPV